MKNDQIKKIKITNKLKIFKKLHKFKPQIKMTIIWFLISLPLNFIITIALFYQLSSPISYATLTKIFGLIVVNVLISAIIYWLIKLIKRKKPKKKL